MNPIDDGGPAFPKPLDPYPNAQGMETGTHGMSLRDWFAGQAAPHILIELYGRFRRDNQVVDNAYTIAALASYELADAMLEARALPTDQSGEAK